VTSSKATPWRFPTWTSDPANLPNEKGQRSSVGLFYYLQFPEIQQIAGIKKPAISTGFFAPEKNLCTIFGVLCV
jgi:hypothetical protein